MESTFTSIGKLGNKDVALKETPKGYLVKFGRAPAKPITEHRIWTEGSKSVRRAIRRAAFKNGFRNFAHKSVHG